MGSNYGNKPGVMIYFEIIPLIEELDAESAGRLFLAILKYSQYGEIPNLSGFERVIWPFIKSLVDRDSVRYETKHKQKQWAVYCRDTKRKGETPLSFEDWLGASDISPMCVDNQNISPIIDDDVCYPTTTPTTTPAPSTAPSTPPAFYNTEVQGNRDRGMGEEEEPRAIDSHRPASAFSGDYTRQSEGEFENKRTNAMAEFAQHIHELRTTTQKWDNPTKTEE